MSDYILFDATLRDNFLTFIGTHGIRYSVRPDQIEGFVVSLTDNLTEVLEDAVEAKYEALMTEQRDLTESTAGADARSVMTVMVRLADDRSLSVQLPALYSRRLYEHFTLDEIRDLVTFIAQSAIDPPSDPACRRG